MRIGVYNRFLTTLGGGERYMLKIAEILGKFADVDILSQELVDRDVIRARMGIDVDDVDLVQLADTSAEAVEAISEKYDLFINASHLDPVASRAPRSILLVHFPSPTATGLRGMCHEALDRLVCPLVNAPILESGFSHREGTPDSPFWWTNGEGRIRIPSVSTTPPRLLVPLASHRPGNVGPMVHFRSGHDELGVVHVPAGGEFNLYPVTPTYREGADFLLTIQSDTFRPAPTFNDPRKLGVAVGPIRAAGWRGRLSRSTLERLAPGPAQHLYTRSRQRTPGYVTSYDRIWTVSNFVRHWTKRYWQLDSSLINPPVDVEGIQSHGYAPKENLIINVGRFFEGHHNKKHLEMVEAFSRMLADGLSGWTLVLVGGVPDEPVHREYLCRVRESAAGLPIRIANDISYSELLDLYARASVYWHATGLGEDEGRDPAAMEHFGITTVEAMAAGAVPVVINRAGQSEIVRHRECGLLWDTIGELQARTWELIRSPHLRAQLSEAARRRSHHFSHASFERRLIELVKEVAPLGDDRK